MILLFASALAAAQAWYGVVPGTRLPAGDFANYYTASRVAAGGEELTPAYTDFVWFQQRMEAAGVGDQLGGFVPHPPATALVMLPLAGLGPLAAKRVWTAAKVAAAAACVWALSRLAGVGLALAALSLLGTGVALANDFAFGQMYVPLLLTIAGGLLLVERGWRVAGGAALGLLLAVKPFALPLVVYFAARRDWRVVGGAAASSLAVTAGSLAVLGSAVHARYLAVVLPHQLAGALQDPFHPLWQSWHSLSRRLFLAEPTLNPAPALDAPWLAGLLPALAGAAGWAAVAMLVYASPERRRLHYAAIVLAALALAPGGATYHIVLLALPLALLAGELCGRRPLNDRAPEEGDALAKAQRRKERRRDVVHSASPFAPLRLCERYLRPVRSRLVVATVLCAALLALPLPAAARRFDGGWTTPLAYPRLWLLVALLAVALAALRLAASRPVPRRAAAAAVGVVLAAGAAGAARAAPRETDGARPVAISAPELSGPDRTVRARPELRGGRLTFLAASPATGRFERFTPEARIGAAPLEEAPLARLSPDGRRLAFVAERGGDSDVWVRELATGAESRVTRGPGVDADPCWVDDRTIVFASDRGRGLAYTTLYEINIFNMGRRE